MIFGFTFLWASRTYGDLEWRVHEQGDFDLLLASLPRILPKLRFKTSGSLSALRIRRPYLAFIDLYEYNLGLSVVFILNEAVEL